MYSKIFLRFYTFAANIRKITESTGGAPISPLLYAQIAQMVEHQTENLVS